MVLVQLLLGEGPRFKNPAKYGDSTSFESDSTFQKELKVLVEKIDYIRKGHTAIEFIEESFKETYESRYINIMQDRVVQTYYFLDQLYDLGGEALIDTFIELNRNYLGINLGRLLQDIAIEHGFTFWG